LASCLLSVTNVLLSLTSTLVDAARPGGALLLLERHELGGSGGLDGLLKRHGRGREDGLLFLGDGSGGRDGGGRALVHGLSDQAGEVGAVTADDNGAVDVDDRLGRRVVLFGGVQVDVVSVVGDDNRSVRLGDVVGNGIVSDIVDSLALVDVG